MENKVYTINSWHIDSDFGGIIINAEIRGKEFELGAQLDNDDTEYYVGDSCWAFINGRAIDDGSAKITEIDIDELEIEVCGNWIWIGGNTYKNKAAIKELGCFWAKAKKLWYWKPTDYSGGKRKKTLEMSEIRYRYGSDVFQSRGQKVLTA